MMHAHLILSPNDSATGVARLRDRVNMVLDKPIDIGYNLKEVSGFKCRVSAICYQRRRADWGLARET
jgi:hypothetical protein